MNPDHGPSPPATQPLRRRWLWGVGLSIAVALVVAGVLQWRQYQLLDATAEFRNDALGWSFLQIETEQLRLRNHLQTALATPASEDRETLQTRYDVFVSRVGLVDHERAAAIMRDEARYAPAMDKLRAFIASADRYLGPKTTLPLSPEAMRSLLVQLDLLGGPLHELSLATSHVLSQRVSQRNDAVREQIQLSFGLTLFQCLLLLAFGAVLLRQFRALRERERRLQALADSLEAARVEAESASRAKSVFLANMSHEIRTPFHGLLGMMSLLQDTPLSRQQAGFLDTAKESAQHLLNILNDILDVSKLEAGNLQIAPEPLDLKPLVRQVDELMRVQARAKDLALRVTLAPDVPRWVRADATRLKQILFNLLSNAVKFSNAGTVSLAVARAASGALVFEVADTGIGMDEATLSRLFERFVQADATTSRRHGGTGLGLEISRSLARLMGGDISVQSSPGAGSRFTVTLPLEPVEPPAEAPDTATAPLDDAAEPVLRVLVAEDHPVNQAYMEAVLEKLGHRSTFAGNGEEALRAMQAHDFDIVLMDLHMPTMDGFAATRAIRALPGAKARLPIIALTADAFPETQQRAREAGVDDFLAKPAHLPQLRDALTRFAGGEAPARAAAPAGSDEQALDAATVAQVRSALSPEQYGALLEGLFNVQDSTLRDLRLAATRRDLAALRSQAHGLKGAALSLGLRSVAGAAARLQQTSDSALDTDLDDALGSLEGAMVRTRALSRQLKLVG
jgi:signal transduction histidine kinase/CheY-like chemotaxis protein/HPt (histidine-containing phosphotransfer) domain-containing protein